MKAEILEALKVIFQKNPEVNNLYLTSDGNIFRAEHYAHNWRGSLLDKTITTVTRAEVMGVKAVPAADEDSTNAGNGESGTGNGADDEKAEAVKRYIELFDTKPNNFMKLETIKTKIAEKEAELAKEANGGDDKPAGTKEGVQ